MLQIHRPNSKNAKPQSKSSKTFILRECKCGKKASECNSTHCQKKNGLINQPSLDLVKRVIASSGQPLENSSRGLFEKHFNQDFSQVRVHTGPDADESATSIDAEAYTVGNQIVFAQNTYQPKTNVGRKLLAHELTHVVQQKNARTTTDNLVLDSPNSLLEQEASRFASEFNNEVASGKGREKVASSPSSNRRSALKIPPTSGGKRSAKSAKIMRSRRRRPRGGDPNFQRAPGACGWEKYRTLEADVDSKCKSVKRKCDPADLVNMSTREAKLIYLDSRIARFRACARARRKISFECFGRPNASHKPPIINEHKGLRKCYLLRKSVLGEQTADATSTNSAAERDQKKDQADFGISSSVPTVGQAMANSASSRTLVEAEGVEEFAHANGKIASSQASQAIGRQLSKTAFRKLVWKYVWREIGKRLAVRAGILALLVANPEPAFTKIVALGLSIWMAYDVIQLLRELVPKALDEVRSEYADEKTSAVSLEQDIA